MLAFDFQESERILPHHVCNFYNNSAKLMSMKLQNAIS